MGEVSSQPEEVKLGPGWLRRTALGIGLLLLGVICLLLGVSFYFRYIGSSHLAQVAAHVDQLDPGWRWNDLTAHRQPVSPAQNGAVQVEKISRQIPPDWLDENDGRAFVDQDDPPLKDRVLNRDAQYQLGERETQEVRASLAKAHDGLVAARTMANQRGGQFAVRSVEQITGLQSTYWNIPRRIADLLWFDAALAAQEEKPDAALLSARALLNASSTIGDDPYMITHLVQAACRHLCMTSIERTLGQGQPSAAALRATQQLLEVDERLPLQLIALRGERAYEDVQMEWMSAGDFKRLAAGTVPNDDSMAGRMVNRLSTGWYRENHAIMLEWLTEAVEIAKLPSEQQHARYLELDRRVKSAQGYRNVLAALSVPATIKVAESLLRSQVELRLAIVGLSAERYRQAKGQWPPTMESLVPELLSGVVLDPYDGKPLRLSANKSGLLIYSVGLDGVDDGGKVNRHDYARPGTDLGFRLWNVDRRRQPPPPRNGASKTEPAS